jgi:uncharacterized OB-fold protein
MTVVATCTLGVMVRDAETSAFFDAAANGTLVVQACGRCGYEQFPQPFTPGTAVCHGCGGNELSWQPVTGAGQLVTWTVIQGRPAPDGTAAPVTIIGVVELDEGPWLHTQLFDAATSELKPGLRLVAAFCQPDGGEPLPVFRPA